MRYVQLFDWGWDIHGTGTGDDIMNALPRKCKDVDQAIGALIQDLKTQGLLQAVRAGGYDAAFGGARREEEKSRAKERIYSFRDSAGQCLVRSTTAD